MLKKIVIEHYRSCLNTSFEFHPNLSVLIGPNGSGKTNLLQAMMLLNKMSQPEDYGRTRSGGITLTARLRVTFKIDEGYAKLNAKVAAFTDDSNNDVLVAAQQKWNLTDTAGQHATTETPFPGIIHPGEFWRRPSYQQSNVIHGFKTRYF